jgi:hypothetical protein
MSLAGRTMTPIRDLSGALAPSLSARDPDCLARENETMTDEDHVCQTLAAATCRRSRCDFGGRTKVSWRRRSGI